MLETNKEDFSVNIIECKNLTKEYISGDNTVKAVNNISVCFEKGEFCAVTGPSGSGKSTFIHMLSSLEYPTSGEVIYDGKSLGKFSDDQLSILRRRRFGFVFQSYNLVQELTGYENILLPVMLDKKKPDEEYLNDIIKNAWDFKQNRSFAVCHERRPAAKNCHSPCARKQTIHSFCR